MLNQSPRANVIAIVNYNCKTFILQTTEFFIFLKMISAVKYRLHNLVFNIVKTFFIVTEEKAE
jgi:hypothetical protein